MLSRQALLLTLFRFIVLRQQLVIHVPVAESGRITGVHYAAPNLKTTAQLYKHACIRDERKRML